MGASVVLISRNKERLENVLDELPVINDAQKHEILVADFSNPLFKKGLRGLYVRIKPFRLVNNTGGPPGGPIKDAKTEEFMNVFNQHLICNHILVRYFHRMQTAGWWTNYKCHLISRKQPIEGLGV